MGQNLFNEPSVFSYFSPQYRTEKGLLGPEFQIYSTATAGDRADVVNRALYGTTVDNSNHRQSRARYIKRAAARRPCSTISATCFCITRCRPVLTQLATAAANGASLRGRRAGGAVCGADVRRVPDHSIRKRTCSHVADSFASAQQRSARWHFGRSACLPAMAQSGPDYRALVCVFLFGGNDSNNSVIPMDDTSYQAYQSLRAGLALTSSRVDADGHRAPRARRTRFTRSWRRLRACLRVKNWRSWRTWGRSCSR